MPRHTARVRPGDPAQRPTEPHNLLPSERAFADRWSATVRQVGRRVPVGEIERTLDAGGRVDLLYDWETFTEELTDAIMDTLAPEFVASGRAVLDDLGVLAKAEEVVVDVSFTLTSPQATEYARARAGDLVTAVSEETRLAIRRTVTRGFTENLTRREISRVLRSVGTGLNDRYAQAVVTSHLRAAERLAREHPGWSPERISREAQQQSSRYAERLTRSRARTIARTEIQIASNQGKLGGWNEAVAQGHLQPGSVQREWRTGPGSLSGISPCDICIPMHGVRVPFGTPFQPSTGSRMMPPAHPNCRCTAVLVEPGSVSAPGVL